MKNAYSIFNNQVDPARTILESRIQMRIILQRMPNEGKCGKCQHFVEWGDGGTDVDGQRWHFPGKC